MGDYIVKEGQQPLTQQGMHIVQLFRHVVERIWSRFCLLPAKPKPGPADYHPTTELCFRSSPRYSVAGKNKQDTGSLIN